MSYCVVLITAPKGKEPPALAKMLLEKKLCACVNIIKGIDSFFWWQGKLDTAKESMLVVKTKRGILKQLIKAVKHAHSYEVCEIIALPIIGGNKDYLDWVSGSFKKGQKV
jgi:periplasmic divalent cation tolerance protein